jgi:putative effector of murein hydrolase
MINMKTTLWLVLAVALGLFAYSLTAIFVNGFNWHLLYPLLLGIVNLAAFFMLRQ